MKQLANILPTIFPENGRFTARRYTDSSQKYDGITAVTLLGGRCVTSEGI